MRETLLIAAIVLLFSIVCCESYLCKILYNCRKYLFNYNPFSFAIDILDYLQLHLS